MGQFDPAFQPLIEKKANPDLDPGPSGQFDPAFRPMDPIKPVNTKTKEILKVDKSNEPKFEELTGVKFEDEPLPELKPGPMKLPGETLFDPNADWWERAKDAMNVGSAFMNIDSPGLKDFERNVITPAIPKLFNPRVPGQPIPFKEGTRPESTEPKSLLYDKPSTTGQRAYNDIVGGGIEGIAQTISDPRSYIMPFLFQGMPEGMRTPSRTFRGGKVSEVFDENIPFRPGTRDVTPPKPGTSGRELTTWNTRGRTPEPFPNQIPPSTNRKFLSSGSQTSEIRGPGREGIIPVGTNAGLSPVETPRELQVPSDSVIENVLALSKKGQKPEIKSVTERDGTNRVWINGIEHTKLFGPGGPAFNDIKALHMAANDPATFIRFHQLKAQNEVGTPYGPVTKSRFRKTAEGDVVNPETGEVLNTDIENMRTPTGGIAMGGADPRVLDVMATSLYAKNREMVVAKELLQNAVDEHRISGSKEPINIVLAEKDFNPLTGKQGKSITVRDRGRGLTASELYTIFTNVGETGKGGETSASGGFGFAKAAPMLTGKYVEVISVIKQGSKKIELKFSGDPATMKDQKNGAPLFSKEVDSKTPTGLTVKTHFDENANLYDVRDFLKGVNEHSTDVPEIHWYKDDGYSWDKDNVKKMLAGEEAEEGSVNKIARRQGQKPQFSVEHPNVGLDFYYDPAKNKTRSYFEPQILNKGYYEKTGQAIGYGGEYENMPPDIGVNIRSNVEEGNEGYPFTANREQLSDYVQEQIKTAIKEKLVADAKKAVKEKSEGIIKSIKDIPANTPIGTASNPLKRTPAYLDAGSRFTEQEMGHILSHPIDQGLQAVGETRWSDRLKKVGLLFDDANYGVHIPYDEGKQSAILINPFVRGKEIVDASSHAANIAHTMLHEMAHIEPIRGWGERPHDDSFASRLGRVYARMGVERHGESTISQEIHGIITNDTGEYSPEFQELLQLYTDSRGRAEAETNFLSGSKEAEFSTTGRPGGTRGNSGSNGGGTPPPRKPIVDQVYNTRRGEQNISPKEMMARIGVEQEGDVIRALKFFHGLKPTGDLGPVFRQGAFYAGRPFWFKALKQQFISYASQGGHNRWLRDLALDPSIKPDMKYAGFKNGKPVTRMADRVPRSRAEAAGLHLDLGTVDASKMEEYAIGLDDVEKALRIPGVINPATATRRAYQATIANLRLGAFNVLSENYGKYYESLKKTSRNEKELRDAEAFNPDNPILYTRIADEVNQTSGRSKLRIKERSLFGRKMWNERTLEEGQTPENINLVLFSARYAKSRVDQAVKMLGLPMQDPVMKREYMKQILSYAALTGGLLTLDYLSGADMPTWDPRSSRFGKSKYGRRTYADATQGMGKYAVLVAQTLFGETKTGKGKIADLTEGNPVTGNVTDKWTNFMQNQSSPPVAFLTDLANRRERFGGKNNKIDLTSPSDVGGLALRDMIAPISWEDLYEIMKEDPTYIPLIFPDLLGRSLNVEQK